MYRFTKSQMPNSIHANFELRNCFVVCGFTLQIYLHSSTYTMSSAEVPGGGKEYVVVVTTYPTTYGANEGVERTEKRFLQESEIDVHGPDKNVDPSEPGAGFQEYKAAVAFARGVLDNECTFTDHDYTEEDEPPFDSADLENYDNDEEVCITVMTKEEFAVMLQSNMQKMGVVDSQGNIIERSSR
jgi:hypothetical protein